ncbi:MAG TPA: PHP domain-containing protein [Bacilli bacterium]|nr:MAG: histidinol-phosphatase [Tenericutes bacterium ADurb.BinA124]HNZ50495.1 PHP domain-containing protein [Bacilli bacterium]HPN61183.1 PHP domain-containing protein [Bacilli bacterium]HPX84583.1 PHP domain-containing protein [Bacilli bacterium]HQC74419.1 PHP domain-containing protein [Bacilli bacterium]
MNKISYHNHTYLCKHAIGEPMDYIKRAVELHYREFGMSDHGPLVPGWGLRMTMKQYREIYLPQIAKAKEKYQTQIQIFQGLELEYLEEYQEHYQKLLLDLDYLILGQHVCYYKNKIHDIYRFMNDETLESYKDLVIQGMESGFFKILAHPDVFMYKHPKWNQKTEEISRQIIESAINNHVILEINVNGIRQKPFLNDKNQITYIYPRLEFWSLVAEYPTALTMIGEDNHDPALIGDEACVIACNMARRLGLKPITKLLGD